MFPEHVEQNFLDPEYSFDEYFQLGSRRKVGPIKNQLASPNTSNYVCKETFAQLRMGFRPEFVNLYFPYAGWGLLLFHWWQWHFEFQPALVQSGRKKQ